LSFGAFCGAHYLYKTAVHNIGRPSLGTWENTGRSGLYHDFIEPLFEYPSERRAPRAPVFNPEIQRKMDEIVASFLGLAQDGKTLQHLLVYGPPGTGKTMVSTKIVRDVIEARNGNVNCIRMSGGDFEQFIGRNEHITELHKLFNTISRSKDPTILVIDEFEALGGDRQTHLRQELISLQDAFLARTGTETRKFMLITATNLVESLDPAIVDRFAHKICVGLPSFEQRMKIISEALEEYFSQREIVSLFTGGKIREIAQKTEGFSGRKILELISKIDSMRYLSPQLTVSIIDRKVQESVDEENGVKQLRQAHQQSATGSSSSQCSSSSHQPIVTETVMDNSAQL
jgi:ATPase family AAA domain-containing protein 3A/B